jgi:histidinol-phosphate aminotransferase
VSRNSLQLEHIHGGTDALPDPRYDFSSNANPLGPCPSVLAAVRSADVTRYPDPSYTQLRATLAAFHGTTPDRIVVGAGASELIVRLIRHVAGSVQQLSPTFSEYALGAHLAGRRLISAHSPAAFLRAQLRHRGIGFICWPNNPTGDLWPLDFVATAAGAGPLVVDMAYAPLCDPPLAEEIEVASSAAYRLYSPNKAFGLTGVRGAYLILPRADQGLAGAAPSWVMGRDAVAMLEAASEPRARVWLARCLPQVQRWRRALVRSLTHLGLQVRDSPATFLLVKVGDAARVAAHMRSVEVRVRDCTSFGMREWIRLSAQAPGAQRTLLAALKNALH